MSEHRATIRWASSGDAFLSGRYSREHEWEFDGGMRIPASPSPSVVREPWSNPANVDPEEAFVAALSSCHMLSFLYLASKRGFRVDRYEDAAVGLLAKNERGARWVSVVTLRPRIAYGGAKLPTEGEVAELHRLAHEECFIANSVRTDVRVASPVDDG